MTASVVVLTRNEARHIEACLKSLRGQEGADLEILVLDAASTDGTPDLARRAAQGDPRVRVLETGPLSVGAARNLGVREARGEFVLFLSADAEAEPGWAQAALRSLEAADGVYGRQRHDPLRVTVAAVSRGLRYHTFDAGAGDPARLASHVNAGYRRSLLLGMPFSDDAAASALDDLLTAHRALASGARLAYATDMVVRHHDVTALSEEWRKVRREAFGWGVLRAELGWNGPLLAWAAALAAALALAAMAAHPAAWALPALVAAAPGLRRLAARRQRYPLGPTVGALAVAPLLDLAFLAEYVRGLTAPVRRVPA